MRCGTAVKTGTSPLSFLGGGVLSEEERGGVELAVSETTLLVTRRAEGGGGVAPVPVPLPEEASVPPEEGRVGVEPIAPEDAAAT